MPPYQQQSFFDLLKSEMILRLVQTDASAHEAAMLQHGP
jgi:hypothetical protein